MSVTWNGTIVSGPILIYHDEVLIERCPTPLGDLNRPGSLVCRSEEPGLLQWHCPFRCTGTFILKRSSPGQVPNVIQNVRRVEDPTITDPDFNGLWNCRLNRERNGSLYVGLYARGGGKAQAVIWPFLESEMLL